MYNLDIDQKWPPAGEITFYRPILKTQLFPGF